MGKLAKLVGNAAPGGALGNATPGGDRESIPSQGMVTSEEPQQKPKASDLDPRPDLVEDHRQWVAVLSLTWYRDRDLWGLLHGLRCGGARLETKRASDGREMFRLDYRPLLNVWSEQELRSQWLEPYREAMKRLFAAAPELMQSVEAEFAKMAG